MKNMISGSTARNHATELSPFQRSAEFNNLMNYFWNYLDARNTDNIQPSEWEPHLQVVEGKDMVSVTAELPGVNVKDIDVQISSDGYLSVCGEKKNMFENNEKGSCFSELSFGAFKRTISLPWDLDYENASANYRDGILTISIPKSQVEKQKFKKISITTSQN